MYNFIETDVSVKSEQIHPNFYPRQNTSDSDCDRNCCIYAITFSLLVMWGFTVVQYINYVIAYQDLRKEQKVGPLAMVVVMKVEFERGKSEL